MGETCHRIVPRQVAKIIQGFLLEIVSGWSNFRPFMRLFLTWLLVFGVFAGLGLRAVAADAGHTAMCAEDSSHCGQSGHDHHHGHDSHDHEDEDCPPDHHHHYGCCFQGMPMTAEMANACRISDPSASFLGVRHECEVPPDGPFLSSEKPPQI
jgi:hypothetical protein